jgi:hypothetical protein
MGGSVGEQIHVFITLVLERRGWSDSSHSSFDPGERVHGTHEPGGSIGARQDAVTCHDIAIPKAGTFSYKAAGT